MWYEEWRRKVTAVHHLFKPYICLQFLAFDIKAFVTAFPGCSALSLTKGTSPALCLI